MPVHFISNPEIITNPQNRVVVSCLLETYLNLKTGFKNYREKTKWIDSTMYENLCVSMSLTLPYYKFFNNWENACREYKQRLVSKEFEWIAKNRGAKNEKGEWMV